MRTSYRSSVLALALSLPILAAASTTPVRRQFNQCFTGDAQCCNQTESSYSNIGAAILALFGISVGETYGLIGLTCSPITAIGFGGNSCSAQPVCCDNNSFNGVIALGCTPINLNL